MESDVLLQWEVFGMGILVGVGLCFLILALYRWRTGPARYDLVHTHEPDHDAVSSHSANSAPSTVVEMSRVEMAAVARPLSAAGAGSWQTGGGKSSEILHAYVGGSPPQSSPLSPRANGSASNLTAPPTTSAWLQQPAPSSSGGYGQYSGTEQLRASGWTSTTAVSGGGGSLQLEAEPEMVINIFQEKWGQFAQSDSWSTFLEAEPTVENLEAAFARQRIFCIASGVLEGKLKLYLFAQTVPHADFLLAEVIVPVATRTLSAKFKAEKPGALKDFVALFERALRPLSGVSMS
eukprot:gnl/Hemi2/26544_TR8915_c0_g1_i1.p1 gnl/Hemi2/26544_TR8915_c0_g1~~gnl/Hemi2/26544_TR8915_c0_g1_i1.p1  ORF type:complete len:292 (+),score=62.27 gnl/Hemi2/26544_TR8915_c0_g1_i1:41-916(+)